jgi:Na+(H+)/acetate symporter ActP
MNISTLGKHSLQVSHWLFLALVVSLTLMLAVAFLADPRGFDISPVPFALLIAIAFPWQVFTLYHNRSNLLTWILAMLYGIPVVFLLCALVSIF